MLFKLLAVISIVQVVKASDLIIHTNVGTIRGIRATDGDYHMFLGIPYGQVNKYNPFAVSRISTYLCSMFDFVILFYMNCLCLSAIHTQILMASSTLTVIL